jgi:hypothetical protein
VLVTVTVCELVSLTSASETKTCNRSEPDAPPPRATAEKVKPPMELVTVQSASFADADADAQNMTTSRSPDAGENAPLVFGVAPVSAVPTRKVQAAKTVYGVVIVKIPLPFHCSVRVLPAVAVTSAGVVSSNIDATSSSLAAVSL